MEQTLQQLGGLLLGAIPTVVLLLLLYSIYHTLVHKPLEAVLAERRKRTQGAIEQARADIALAASRSEEHESRLREARLSIFKLLDNRRKQALEARAAAVAEARRRAKLQIAEAKAAIERDAAAARTSLDSTSDSIASQIIGAVLHPAGRGPAPWQVANNAEDIPYSDRRRRHRRSLRIPARSGPCRPAACSPCSGGGHSHASRKLAREPRRFVREKIG